MAKRLSTQVEKRLDKIDLESVLATFGLQVFKQRRSLAWPLVTAFGAGAMVGVLFAPMSGKDLRGRIVDLARRATKGVRELTLDGKPVASPMEDATRERDERVNATPRSARRVQALPGETGPHLSSPT